MNTFNESLCISIIEFFKILLNDNDEVEYKKLADSFLNAYEVYQEHISNNNEMKIEISDGYNYFKMHLCFDDYRKSIIDAEVIKNYQSFNII